MKFSFKQDDSLLDNEIVVSHNHNEELVKKLYNFLISEQKKDTSLKLYADDTQYFIPVKEIIFFETEGGFVYAHTHEAAYQCDLRLYEVLDILPESFVRISKSTICNTQEILSISRYLTANGTIRFRESNKEVYVSRNYYNNLKQHLEKRI